MLDEQDPLDAELARLADLLRCGELMLVRIRLVEFALKLDTYIRRDERVLSSSYSRLREPATTLAMIHAEHKKLRGLIGSIASALEQGEAKRGLELVGKLRSVLLLHLAKEEQLTH